MTKKRLEISNAVKIITSNDHIIHIKEEKLIYNLMEIFAQITDGHDTWIKDHIGLLNLENQT